MRAKWPIGGAVLLPIALAVVGAACTVQVDSEQRIGREEKRFTVAGDPQLHISTFDGAVEVRSWDRNEVLVEIEKRGRDDEALKSIQVKAEQQGNRIDNNQEYGAEIGGPIIKDHLWIWGSYSQQQIDLFTINDFSDKTGQIAVLLRAEPGTGQAERIAAVDRVRRAVAELDEVTLPPATARGA